MNDCTLSGCAFQVVKIVRSSRVLGSLAEEHPDLLALFIRAGERVDGMSAADQLRVMEAVKNAADSGDAAFDEWFSRGDTPKFADLDRTADRAHLELGMVLKELCPDAVPIVTAPIAAAN
jgi:hypothetical protein